MLLVGPRAVTAQQAKPTDIRALAHKLVTQTVILRAGDVVLITGGVLDAQLLEDLAIEARAMGAHPLISIGSDRLDRRLYDEVPAKFDAQIPQLALKLAGLIEASINVDYSQTSRVLEGVPPERIAARTKAGAQVGALLRERRVQDVFLGNDLSPIEERAERFGISPQQLAEAYWSAANSRPSPQRVAPISRVK
jgi:leucyl aminopeptidase (aminopeptidase T)